MSWWCSFFTYLGFLVFLNFLYDTFISPLQLLYHKWLKVLSKEISLVEKYGKWAAITGSTDGIGKALARQLARRGFNIVLIARNEEKLKRVAEEIENDFGVEVYKIQADFSHGKPIYEKLFEDLAKKPIKFLVNNVGIANSTPWHGILITFIKITPWRLSNKLAVIIASYLTNGINWRQKLATL